MQYIKTDYSNPFGISLHTLADELLVKRPDLSPVVVERGRMVAQANRIVLARFDEDGKEITPTISRYAVFASEASRPTWYVVNVQAKTCTCPFFKFNGTCKHQIAVYFYRELPRRIAAAYSNRSTQTSPV